MKTTLHDKRQDQSALWRSVNYIILVLSACFCWLIRVVIVALIIVIINIIIIIIIIIIIMILIIIMIITTGPSEAYPTHKAPTHIISEWIFFMCHTYIFIHSFIHSLILKYCNLTKVPNGGHNTPISHKP